MTRTSSPATTTRAYAKETSGWTGGRCGRQVAKLVHRWLEWCQAVKPGTTPYRMLRAHPLHSAPESAPGLGANNSVNLQRIASEINEIPLHRSDCGVGERAEIAVYGTGIIRREGEALEDLLEEPHPVALRPFLDQLWS